MVTQTRYFNSTERTVNGLTVYRLDTFQAHMPQNSDIINKAGNVVAAGMSIGIRVWARHVDTTQTEITAGAPVAIYTTALTIPLPSQRTGTWNAPLTSLASSDNIIVRVYARFAADAWQEIDVAGEAFGTEALGAQSLNAATWTLTYCIDFFYDGTSFTWIDFYFDGVAPLQYSFISNFQFTLAPASQGGKAFIGSNFYLTLPVGAVKQKPNKLRALRTFRARTLV